MDEQQQLKAGEDASWQVGSTRAAAPVQCRAGIELRYLRTPYLTPWLHGPLVPQGSTQVIGNLNPPAPGKILVLCAA